MRGTVEFDASRFVKNPTATPITTETAAPQGWLIGPQFW